MHAAAPSGSASPTTPQAHLLLTRLIVAFSRRRAYPATHPLVLTAEAQAFETVSALVSGRRGIAIALARHGLLMDDAPVETAVAHDLANRLRLRGIGALAIDSAVTADALRDAITWLATEQADGAVEASATPPTLPGIRITRIDYGKLALGDELGGDLLSVEDIWRELALGALDDDVGEHGELDPSRRDDAEAAGDSSGMVAAAERRLARPDAARHAGSVLLRVADQISRARGSSRAQLAERLQTVLSALQSSSLTLVLESRGDSSDKRRFISQMIEALPVDDIIAWITVAAKAAGEPLSPQLLRILSSVLSRAKQQGAAHDGDAAFRTAARELVNGWTLDEPSAPEHTVLLDRISAFDAVRVLADVADTGAARVVQQALEIDAFGQDATEAAQQLLADGRVGDLMAWSAATSSEHTAATIRSLLRSRAVVNAVLLREPLDQPLARTLLGALDVQAVALLLDVLRDAEGRTARRLVLARLREFGPDISEQLVSRLDGAPWYFARNLLTLLRECSAHNESSVSSQAALLQQLAAHPQEQVRVEALRLLVLEPTTRDAALRRALDDAERRVVIMGIDAMGGANVETRARLVPVDIWQRVVRIAEDLAHEDETRSQALRLLRHAPPSSRVRDLLLSLVIVRSRILRRVALAEPTAVSVAALEVLAQRYRTDAQVTSILAMAADSSEHRYREAARASSTSRGT